VVCIIWRCVVPAEIPPLTPVIVAGKKKTANFLAASNSELLDVILITLPWFRKVCSVWCFSADSQASRIVGTLRKTRRSTCWKCSKWLAEYFLSVGVLCVDCGHNPWLSPCPMRKNYMGLNLRCVCGHLIDKLLTECFISASNDWSDLWTVALSCLKYLFCLFSGLSVKFIYLSEFIVWLKKSGPIVPLTKKEWSDCSLDSNRVVRLFFWLK